MYMQQKEWWKVARRLLYSEEQLLSWHVMKYFALCNPSEAPFL